MGETILEGDLVLGAADVPAGGRSTVVRFKDSQGKTILEVKSAGALVEIADPDGVVFAIDADGNVEA